MAYEIQDLDPVKELSPLRRRLEFSIVFAIVFLVVRFGGWHHGMDPLGATMYPSTLIAVLVAAAFSSVFMLWRIWQSTHTAARETHQN